MRISDWRSDVCSSDLGPHAIAGQVPQPVLDPRVWLGTMVAVVVGDQRTPHPQIGFRLVLGFVEVVQRLVHLLHRAERPLDLALGAGRGVPVVGLRRQMGEDRSEEHTSELPSLMRISYAVFCLKQKK